MVVVPNNNVMSCNQAATADDSSDMLSKLPTDLLVSILEKLSLHDAIRAGVLSRRWRPLPGQLPRLVLNFDDFLPDEEGEYYDQDVPNDSEDMSDDGHTEEDDDPLSAAGDTMLDVATALLASRQHLPTLAMSFLLRHNYMSLGRLLNDAMASGKVRTAELIISTPIEFETAVKSENGMLSARAGYGQRFRALLDGCSAAFGGLTQLALENMAVHEADLNDILTTCAKLELLSLKAFEAGGRAAEWRIRHGRLADLRINLCFVGTVHLVWLPRLERLAHRYSVHHTRQPLSFGHVPSLTTLTVSNDVSHDEPTVKLSHILANTAVKELRLNFRGSDIWVQPEAPERLTHVFRNLKYLKLRNVHEACGLTWTMALLQAAPFLTELYIKLWDHEGDMQPDQNKNCFPVVKNNEPWNAATGFKHYSLTRITIQGFYYSTNNKEMLETHIRLLVQAAVNLEKLSMRENAASKHCDDTRRGFPQMNEEEWLIKRWSLSSTNGF